MLEEYIRRGWIEEQLVKSRALYRAKCDGCSPSLERSMPAGVEWTRAEGGFFSWLTLPGCRRDGARRAAPPRPASGSRRARCSTADGSGDENVRLSFSMVDEALIDEGIERLAGLVAGS